MRRSLEILACLSALCRLWRSTTSNSKFPSNLFLHCLNCTRSQGNNEKVAFVFGCCSLWKSFMKNKCFDSSLTRSRLQTNKYPKQNRINVFYQIYCFTRQQNKWCCLYACEKIVCNQDIFNETKCPPASSQIKQYDLVNYQIWSQTCVSSSLL